MDLKRMAVLCLLPLTLILSCRGSGPESAGGAAPERWAALEAASRTHPRLLLTAESLPELKSRIAGSHQWLWERYLQDLPGKLERAKDSIEGELDRGHADLAPQLAFTALLTGDPEHLAAAKRQLLALAHAPEWDPLNDLVHGHLLQGMALAYDWLYPELSRDERREVFDRLSREARGQYERIAVHRVWYHNQYFQNHAVSNYCGLAFAAAALYGEDPEAGQWLTLCEGFFDQTFAVLPTDGTSLEGISYGGYDFEYLLRFAELSRLLLGQDRYDNPALKNMPAWFLHSLVPAPTEPEWTMTFGDAPRHAGWHGPEPQLFLAAARYGDSQAQWLGRFLIELPDTGMASAAFWPILWYDPAVPAAAPADFPLFWHFTDNEQVMMRSAWDDPQALLVGFKCGPFMGKAQSLTAEWDWGTNHQHPDQGSFQLFAEGRYLAIDPLYTHFKRTANHNSMLFKGRGQLGEDVQWFGVAEALHYRHYPQIVHAESHPQYDYVVGDVTRAYHPALGLELWERHLVFLRPDLLLVADRVKLGAKGVLYSYPSITLTPEGGLTHSSEEYVVGASEGSGGEAWTAFAGPDGNYTITANLLDNHPGQGKYAILVDGQVVLEFANNTPDVDNHLLITPEVALKPGSRIAFRAEPMVPQGRLIRMTAFSATVEAPEPSAEWLLHLDPQAAIEQRAGGLSAALDQARLDLDFFAPKTLLEDWTVDRWEVLRPDRSLPETRRVVARPRLDAAGEGWVLALLHPRHGEAKAPEALAAVSAGAVQQLSWKLDGRSYGVSLDCGARRLTVTVDGVPLAQGNGQ